MQDMNAFLSTYDYLISKIRFKIPFYYGKTWICYLNPVKPDKVELVFLRGQALKSSQLLDSRNRKMVKGLMLQVIEDIPFEIIDRLVKEAIALDNRP
jgi:hypothetical protein